MKLPSKSSYIVSGERYHSTMLKYFLGRGCVDVAKHIQDGIEAAKTEAIELARFQPLWCDLREMWASKGAETA